ncbi:unnamed protein product, partial [Brenthis ino]
MSNMQDQRQDELKGDEVVISGISGVEMVVCVDPHFVHPDVPHHIGRINEPNKLDAQFFKIMFNQAMSMDPMCRKLLEQSYSAIYDAGINPLTLDGKKVGVYVGIAYMDVLNFFMDCDNSTNIYYLSGSSKTMLANRISYYLNTKGPSYAIDASTASSLLSLDQAYQHLLSGEIESAIVAGSNICKQPTFGVNLRRAGLVSLDGKTKCFDENGDGSVRSEAVSVVFLQKAKDAKRIYSQVYHVKSGYSKPEIHCFPNREENDILAFLQEFYSEIDVAPSSVEYVEANAPGIASHDKVELKAISRFFGDKSPVKVGSVKSNMGNSEGASGLCSLTKVCLAYHTGTIAGNINCSNPMKTEKAVILKENVPFNRGFIAINEFSYTGNDAHALLKGYYKPKDHNRYKCSIPYLVLISGRDEDCVNHLFDILQSYPVDPEYVGMLHQIHNFEMKGHTSRGFIILDGNANQQIEALSRSVDYYAGNKRQIWFVFSGMGSQWVGMGETLMRIPIFNEAIQICDKALKPKGLDIIKIICDKDGTIFDNILHCFVGIAAIQIGLVDILKAIGIECDYMIGHSAGETACGYVDGCFTREEMILSAYSRGKASLETNCIPGAMAAVGMGYKDLYPICPPEIDIACHNSSESSTISGPADDITQFLKELTAKEIFCKEVPSSNIAFHSRHISVAGMIVLPESALLVLTWQTLAMSMDMNFENLSVIFKDINFNTQIELKPENLLNLSISITKKNGKFEVVHKNEIIVTGYIVEYENEPMRKVNHSSANTINDVTLFAVDIYKFLNLRGHVYTNQFQSLHSLNLKCSEAYIKWAGDWITFLDGLIQINIFANNHNDISRPKLIESLTIDIYEHASVQYKSNIDNAICYKADYYENFNILRSGGVQVVNINFENLIPQRVESDFLGLLQFWPHFSETEFELNTAIAINMQIIADAILQKDIKVTELRTSNINIISNAIKDVSTQLPIKLRFNHINIENGKLNLLRKHDLSQSQVLVVYDFVMDTETMAAIYDHLPRNGFILSLEKRKNKKYIIQTDYFNILTVFPTNDDYTLVLINKVKIDQVVEDKVVVKVYDDSFSYMNTLRKELNNNKRIVLLYEKQHYCDLKGYLRGLREEYRNKISLFMILDEASPDFNVNNNFYSKQMQKNLPFNTLYDGEWGGYYYTPLNNYKSVPLNSKLSLPELGNINSWHWEEIDNLNKSNTVEVQYVGLSLKDVEKVIWKPVNNKKISFGMDYSGFDTRGNRVMGIIADGAISKEIEYDLDLLWPVPKTWSLEEAATVPLPYALAYYSLALRGTLYAGTTVFINGGAGALGQAVISICLSLNCNIFTTVSDPGKKAFLLKLYPTLKENQILNSRYDDFYASIIRQTNNKRCNYVINCESGIFRNSAIKCLSPLGTYLDLSNKDMIDNKPLGMSFAAEFKYYYSVNFSNIFKPEYSHEKKLLQSMIADGIATGVVRPLTYTMFSSSEVSRAFKFLSTRRHRGRVLFDLRNSLNNNVMPRLVLNPQFAYVVIGDQDELCVSLMDLLIKRGAKKIYLQMRSKAVSPFIEAKMLLWRTQGIEVKVSRYGIEDEEKCKLFISDVAKLGPIEGIFIVLYKLTAPAYTNVPTSISNLDKLSRNMDYLRYFVILSSNVNSSEDERVFSMCSKICHYRNNIGLNALLYRAEFVDEFEGLDKNQTTYQSIHQVLNGMENSIKQNCSNVISYNTNKNSKMEYSRKLNYILGKQTNGTELDVNASLHDIAIDKLTIKEIRGLILEHYQVAVSDRKLIQMSLSSIQNVEYYLDELKNNIGLDAIISYVNDDSYEACDSFKQMLTLTNNIPEKLSDMEYVDPAADYLILIPGFQGDCGLFEPLCSTLKIKGITVQLGPDLAANTISEMAESVLKNAVIRLEEKNKFYILGYSFGVNIALEVAALLEKKGIVGTVFCLDSSPDALRVQLNTYTSDLADEEVQNVLIDHIYYLITKETNNKLKEEIKTFNKFEEKVTAFVKETKERVPYPQEYIRLSVESVYKRISLAMKYNPTYTLESEIVLLKAINDSNAEILPYDYNLAKYTKKPVKVVNVESNHTTLPFNVNVPNVINKMLDKELLTKYKNTNLCKTYLIKMK